MPDFHQYTETLSKYCHHICHVFDQYNYSVSASVHIAQQSQAQATGFEVNFVDSGNNTL